MEFPSPSPTPRRISRPRWLDLRLVLGIVLVLAAVVLGARVVSGARHTEREVAVTRNLAAGATLRSSDLRQVDAQLSGTNRVYVTDPRRAVGKVLGRDLVAGELLPSAALGAAPARTTVSVPFAADTAPKLARGQRIVVWLSTPACPSVVLLSDVTVQDVKAADSGTFSSGGAGQDVVLSISSDLAERINTALAVDNATIRAGVLTGAAPSSTAQLPALDACGASASASSTP